MSTPVSAFPRVVKYADDSTEVHFGMTLRHYFAAQALIGLLSGRGDHSSSLLKHYTKVAFEYADAMIEAADDAQN